MAMMINCATFLCLGIVSDAALHITAYDVFIVLVLGLQRFEITYYCGWTPSMSIGDQLLLTLMKLNMNCKDADLAVRFNISRATVSNIFNSLICALHELLYDGVLQVTFPSQLKCEGSMPKSFEEFGTARASIDALEMTRDMPTSLSLQARSYSNYKSRHTVKAVNAVAPNGTIAYLIIIVMCPASNHPLQVLFTHKLHYLM